MFSVTATDILYRESETENTSTKTHWERSMKITDEQLMVEVSGVWETKPNGIVTCKSWGSQWRGGGEWQNVYSES